MPNAAILLFGWIFALCGMAPSGFAAERISHGLWVWKTAAVLHASESAKALRDFCVDGGVNEVYISFSARQTEADEARLAACIDLLHRSNVSAEALLSSTDADEPGKPRDHFLAHVGEVLDFNQRHDADRFDGIHLDIEPHQRPENKGADNLRFLADLIQTFDAVRAQTDAAHLTLDADIPVKVLKADLDQRTKLFLSVSRITLMLYEIASPDDGQTPDQKADKLRKTADKYFAMAYDGIDDPHPAGMSIALRTADYLTLLPKMLASLDDSFRANPHYAGWARHSYNDQP
jgi:hypothetical protein